MNADLGGGRQATAKSPGRQADPGPVTMRRASSPGSAHLDAHDGYVAFSGGKDSLVVLHLALAAVPVAFFDSGLEFPEIYEYVGRLARDWNFEGQLHWITVEPPLLQVLHDTAAWDHWRAPERPVSDLHEVLISRSAAIAHGAHGPGGLWGVRKNLVHCAMGYSLG